MANDKNADDKHHDDQHHADKQADNTAEDLTPTPTQAEMDKVISGLSDEDLARAKKPETKEGVEQHHITPTSDPPTLTQDENDAAMELAAPGDKPPDEINPVKRDARQKEEAEAKRRKDIEAEQHPAGYQTRATNPTHKK